MHDFCLTIPYGILVLVGGVMGYVKRGSTASLAGGAASGSLLLIAGVLSFKGFDKRKNSYLALILETVVAFALTWVMGQRYIQTSKIMPAGIVAGLRDVNAILLFLADAHSTSQTKSDKREKHAVHDQTGPAYSRKQYATVTIP